MRSKIKDLDGTRKRLNIEMPEVSVEAVFDEVIEEIRRNAELPGFRVGKAPVELIRKKYASHAQDEVKKRIIPRAYQEALGEHELEPISYPEISEVSLSPSGALSFTAEFDTEPEFTLKKYTGIKVTGTKCEVTDEEVQKAVDHIKRMSADMQDKEGPLEKGDHAVCDVETFSGEERISQKRENMWIEVDSEASMLGMGEELIGLSRGDDKEIDAVLPENYPDERYAGKEVRFKVKVKETKRRILPAEDDQLAEKHGKGSMEELRGEIRKQLLQRKEVNARVGLKNQILQHLIEKHPFPLPVSMVRRQHKVLSERVHEDLTRKGLSGDELENKKDELDGQIEREAGNKVRLYFVLRAIALKEGIDVGPEEIDAWLAKLGETYGQGLEDVRKYYEEHDLIEGLRAQLAEDKTIEYLLQEAQISEA